MQFFSYPQTLLANMSDPSSYREVLRRPLRFAFLFFLSTVVLVTIGSLTLWRLRTYPQLVTAAAQQIDAIAATLPDSYQAQYAQGTLTHVGAPEDLVIPTVGILRDFTFPERFAVLRATDAAYPQTFLTFGPTMVIASRAEMSPTSLLYTDIEPTNARTLSKTDIITTLQETLSRAQRLSPLLILLAIPFIILFFALPTILLVCILSFVTQSVAWIMGIRMRYVSVVKLGLHAAAIALVIDEIQLSLSSYTTMSVLTLAYAGIMLFVLLELRKRPGTP